MTFPKEYRSYLPLVVMLSLFSGMGLIAWFGIAPFQNFITEKADGIQEYYASRENRERQINRLPELQDQFASIQADEQTLGILLSEEKIVDFVKTLEGLAAETHTSIAIQAKDSSVIEEKTPLPVSKKAAAVSQDSDSVPKKASDEPASILDSVPYDRYLHVNVVVTGEYRDIVSFLHKMETLPLGIDVVALSMRAIDKETQSQQAPSTPGRNPFLMLSSGSLVPESVVPEVAQPAQGSLEASFDTVVYLSK